jgi:hypothetical protein
MMNRLVYKFENMGAVMDSKQRRELDSYLELFPWTF